MPPNAILLHMLRGATAEQIRRMLYAAMDKLTETRDVFAIERITREPARADRGAARPQGRGAYSRRG